MIKVAPKRSQKSTPSPESHSADRPCMDPKDYQFSEEAMQALRELGEVLREIYDDLIAQGYIIKDRKIIHLPNDPKKRE